MATKLLVSSSLKNLVTKMTLSQSLSMAFDLKQIFLECALRSFVFLADSQDSVAEWSKALV